MTKDLNKVIIGALCVTVIILFGWNIKLDNQIAELKQQPQVIVHKKSNDEMFDKFLNLVITLKEMENENGTNN